MHITEKARTPGRRDEQFRPVVGITMGDPAGIGPEIIVKAWQNGRLHAFCSPIVIGDASVLTRANRLVGAPLEIVSVTDASDACFAQATIEVFDLANVDQSKCPPGQVSEVAGKAAFEVVEAAIRLAVSGKIDAVATCPINKEALNLAGYSYAGHTEIFAALTGSKRYAMMLAEGDFRVVHVSTHVSLREACERVTKARVLEVIELADEACKSLGIEHPVVAVAGLNPHCGEGGLFGLEDEREIRPAVADAASSGIEVIGPLPADTLFPQARAGRFDVVVAMYHDQGHIPVKLAGFSYNGESGKWDSVQGVNITLGLSVIRTSVDHGTAFDQAGKGTASEESLVNAVSYAARLAEGKARR